MNKRSFFCKKAVAALTLITYYCYYKQHLLQHVSISVQ